MRYQINDIHPCVQGEGVHAGVPMVLIRLQGCGVGCPWCDSKETWGFSEKNRVGLADALGTNPRWAGAGVGETLAFVRSRPPKIRWALITGGEPAGQDLAPLAKGLKEDGYRTAIETSGTARGHLGAGFDWICVSPKFDMPGGGEPLPECLESAHEIKHVAGKPADIDRLDRALDGLGLREGVVISLQPESLGRKATELCVKTVMERGWRLSLQTHKFINQR
ncbi:7-carboxy-7-deazaguanine synthase [Candidatus Desulfarcum epimagneticum]|uniref:7-carboxy-7-deazaguanine synthase n=1 Tax=uncultured Desulfobacteraceae bacterium TaxID=218296 RepID=A0A484HIF6_9BACT|nr:7-carboxy-7-deazaguanine synthase [uncultured Desulfobacteraceae bacterium]